jgi:hypothetical protein
VSFLPAKGVQPLRHRAGEGQAVDTLAHAQRLAWFDYHYRRELPEVTHLVLYNSGSLLNPREMSPSALRTICDWAAQLPSLRMLSLDTRELFVNRQRPSRSSAAPVYWAVMMMDKYLPGLLKVIGGSTPPAEAIDEIEAQDHPDPTSPNQTSRHAHPPPSRLHPIRRSIAKTCAA